MISRRRTRHRGEPLSVDSLTDILANSIGVVLFVLLFSVLSSRTTYLNFQIPEASRSEASTAYVPVAQQTARSQTSILCSRGELLPMEIDVLLERLTGGAPQRNFRNFPDYVSMLNNRTARTDSLEGRIATSLRETEGFFSRSRGFDELILIVNRRRDVKADTLADLDSPDSAFRRLLARLDADTDWLSFHVTSDSVDIFRKARLIAWSEGFQVGWEPTVWQWPLTIDLLAPRGTSAWTSKPTVNLGGGF